MAGVSGKFIRAGLALCAALLSSGCVALGGIDRTAFTIDKSVGEARNRSILTNIVRASNSEPLYFYSINQVSGAGLADFKFSLPPFTEGSRQTAAQDSYTFGATNLLEGNQSGNFQVAVLDSKNFYAGMMAPFELTELNVLLRQGFPRELVYRLAVQDITIYAADPRQPQTDSDHPKGVLQRYVNDPASAESYAKFNTFLAAAISHGITIEEYQVQPKALDSGTYTTGKGGKAGAGAGAASPVVAGRLCSDMALISDPTALTDVKDSGNACGARPTVEAADVNSAGGIDNLQNTWMNCFEIQQKRKQANGKPQDDQGHASQQGGAPQNRVCAELNGQVIAIQLNTRSLYGVLRYLGGLLADGKDVELAGLGAESETKLTGALLTIQKDPASGACFASVDWHGHYCIPQDHSEPLKQTFSIINALQALKTSPGDLPITPTVRIEQ